MTYFEFHVGVRGYDFVFRNEKTPKFILYLKGFTPESLLLGKTKYRPISRV